ncbi:MAG: hypothetical protein A2161_16790 [Candidatus Schekmanbacteria bacterium RBG_13_48_7]|uniref:CheW-like domain-containing protein n=1 Tax=Candidatus Schekmanbacteria bacterium RBG_13_48_7 TaxID=1817878 RepID=A0A1F7RJN1_9BACT|nr:MAG: hypothetical protein A2161_16790 [Candidatus Schekmanbacteria bacterium RBG_13_48_7]
MDDYKHKDNVELLNMLEISGAANQYLLFQFRQKLLAINLHELRSIVPVRALTPVPGCPPHYRGVISLRGTVIPVLDFSYILEKESDDQNRSFIIVLKDEQDSIGITADKVLKISILPEEDILPVETYLTDNNPEFYSGIFRYGNRYGLIINFEMMIKKTLETIDD